MQTRKDRWQEDLFVASPLSTLVPEDHLLKRVDRVLDLSWIHEAVEDRYCQDNGRGSIDPESALRLMLAGFFEGIVHDRKLMRRAQTDLAIRWFAGYRLDEALPDHSSLTRIRQRWGEAVFRQVFERTVRACAEAGLVNTHTVHVDATLIRADVSWDSLTTRHADQVIEAHRGEEAEEAGGPPADDPAEAKRGRPRGPERPKKSSPTDPDATMATSSRGYHLEPTYKQHTAVEDQSGIIVDVVVTTGEYNEGKVLLEHLERIESRLGTPVKSATGDAAYAHAANYDALEQRGTDPVIPPQRQARRKGKERIPSRRFKYDAKHRCLTCPAGKRLCRSGRNAEDTGSWYRARRIDCQACPLRTRCLSPKAPVRAVVIVDAYPALLRARRRKARGWDDQTRETYKRHRWRVEGIHGRAKTHHGLRRAARRGLTNIKIQAYLTAIVMNLKTWVTALEPYLLPIWLALKRLGRPLRPSGQTKCAVALAAA
jgi:transposase